MYIRNTQEKIAIVCITIVQLCNFVKYAIDLLGFWFWSFFLILKEKQIFSQLNIHVYYYDFIYLFIQHCEYELFFTTGNNCNFPNISFLEPRYLNIECINKFAWGGSLVSSHCLSLYMLYISPFNQRCTG